MQAELASRSAWLFDLDGTLTVAVHDFAAIRAQLGLPRDRPILESIAELEPEAALSRLRRLDEIEAGLALGARPADGAHALCAALARRGRALGILTRNSHANALVTLRATGLDGYFAAAHVLGRDESARKPSPAGVLRLLGAFDVPPAAAVMVGDSLQDLLAGRAAGVATVHVDRASRFRWPEHTDVCVDSLAALADLIADS
jgi:HAD superfamily hydrolase (TIGR01509 family)